MSKLTKMSTGLPLLFTKKEGGNAVTVLILVKAGARYEHKSISGVAHFLEHMFFKGAKKYPTAKAVSEAIDHIGGEFNAFTGKETAGYYVKVAADHMETAFSVLSDMMQHSTFDKEEMEKERGVIIEELRMYQDTPTTQIYWDFASLLYGDQPLGWDEGGTEESVSNLTREDLVQFKADQYRVDNMVLSVTGNVSEERVKELTEQYFNHLDKEKPTTAKVKKDELIGKQQTSLRKKDYDQLHLVYGTYLGELSKKDRHAMRIASTILGGNMSSRLFQHLREELGLCYYVSSGAAMYTDAGHFYVRAGVTRSRLEDALAAIRKELSNATGEGLTEDDLRNAKEYIKGQMALSMEDTEDLSNFVARMYLKEGELITLEEYLKEVEAITLEDIRSIATTVFSKPFHLAASGNIEEEELQAALTNASCI